MVVCPDVAVGVVVVLQSFRVGCRLSLHQSLLQTLLSCSFVAVQVADVVKKGRYGVVTDYESLEAWL